MKHYILIDETVSSTKVIGWWITSDKANAIELAKKEMKIRNLTWQQVSFIEGVNINLE